MAPVAREVDAFGDVVQDIVRTSCDRFVRLEGIMPCYRQHPAQASNGGPMRAPEVLVEFWQAQITTRTSSRAIRRLRWALAVAWFIALAITCRFHGVPTALWQIILWLAAAMLIASIANPLGWAKSMLVDWFPLYLALALYGIPWALVSHTGIRAHVYPQLLVDRWIFGNRGGTDILQSALWRGAVRWLDYAAWLVYASHFFVTIVVCAILWMHSRSDFLRYRRRVVSTWLTALFVFAVYPTVPPWMAADQGYVPHLTRIIPRVIRVIATGDSVPTSSQIAAHAHLASDDRIAIYNPVAAVPSMHSALPALLALYCWNRWPKLRPLVAAYPVAMGFALVYGGEHFAFDVLAGWTCAAVVHFTWCRIESQREKKLQSADSGEASSGEEVGRGDLVETAAL
jgi:hypothetical protein